MKIDDRAIGMFENDLFSLQMIGDFFGATRQGVKKFLNKRGVDTSKRKYKIECDECGNEFEKTKSYIRNRTKNYCSPECYYAAIHNPNYNQNRQGQRNARNVVRELGHILLSEEVVHHEDGNTENNDPMNLKVFANQSDHMRWHRAGGEESGVVPVWRGNIKVTNKVIKTVADIPKDFVYDNPVQGKTTFRSFSKAEQLGKKVKK